METWEYAMLGWYTDPRTRKPVFFWRPCDQKEQRIRPDEFAAALAKAGEEGWELTSATALPGSAETLFLKRAAQFGSEDEAR